MESKLFFGLGLGGEVLKKQLANELYKPHGKQINFLKVKVFNKDEIWSADLVDMPKENSGRSGKYKFTLTVIDLYTRFAWGIL